MTNLTPQKDFDLDPALNYLGRRMIERNQKADARAALEGQVQSLARRPLPAHSRNLARGTLECLGAAAGLETVTPVRNVLRLARGPQHTSTPT